MTPEERKGIFDWLTKEEYLLILSKGKDYAGEKDILRNFKESAEMFGLTKYQVWMVYCMKHIMAITNSIQRNPDLPIREAESLEGSIMDARNYLGLLACLLSEDLEMPHYLINKKTGEKYPFPSPGGIVEVDDLNDIEVK